MNLLLLGIGIPLAQNMRAHSPTKGLPVRGTGRWVGIQMGNRNMASRSDVKVMIISYLP